MLYKFSLEVLEQDRIAQGAMKGSRPADVRDAVLAVTNV